MERVSVMGRVHFVGHDRFCLCGEQYRQKGLFAGSGDMLGKPTHDPVDCPACAKLYCQVKNAPWNEVEDRALDTGIYAAVGIDHREEDGDEH